MKKLAATTLTTAMTAATVVAGVATSPASAEPGVPSEPTVIYAEDFENRPAGSNILLSDYTSDEGIDYTAEFPWISREACNGLVIDWASTQTLDGEGNGLDCIGTDGAQAPGDRWFALLQRLIFAQGVVAGLDDPTTNAGVASFTSNPHPGANKIQFATADPIAMPSSGRFVTFSVDATAMSCQATHPQLRFYIVDGEGNELPVADAPIDPCTGAVIDVPAKNGYTGEVRGARFTADGARFVAGQEIGIVLRNENGSAGGNDGAYDNIRVLDATPALDKVFEPVDGTRYTGDDATLSFTVTNTTELAEKAGWSFTDTLPEGVEVTGAATTTCAAADVETAAGDEEIVVESGTIAAGQASCTITVPVTGAVAGEFENGPDNVATTGLNPPGTSTITFVDPAPELTLEKDAELDDANGNGVADAGEQITYSFHVENTGNMDLTEVVVGDEMLADAGVAVTPESVDLAVDEEADFVSDPYTVTADDVETGEVVNVAVAIGLDRDGGPVVSDEATATVATSDLDAGGSGGGETDGNGVLPDTGGPIAASGLVLALAALTVGAALVRRRRDVPVVAGT